MKSRWVWLAVVAGCNFTPIPPDPGSDGTDADTTTRATCSVPGTKLCLEFNSDTDPMQLASDGSGNGHDALATDVALTSDTPHDAKAGELLTITSSLTVAATADLDIIGDLSIELWVNPLAPLPGVRYWVVDHGGRYFVSIDDMGRVRCGINNSKTVDSAHKIPFDGTWHHIGCTFEPAATALTVFFDGGVSGCANTDAAIASGASTATAIGKRSGSVNPAEHFYGGLDNVHVYASTLAPAEMCFAATGSGTSCSAKCPDGG